MRASWDCSRYLVRFGLRAGPDRSEVREAPALPIGFIIRASTGASGCNRQPSTNLRWRPDERVCRVCRPSETPSPEARRTRGQRGAGARRADRCEGRPEPSPTHCIAFKNGLEGHSSTRIFAPTAASAPVRAVSLVPNEDNGGETGIRTLGGVAPTTVFETAPFDHSGTSPHTGWLVCGRLFICVSGRAQGEIAADSVGRAHRGPRPRLRHPHWAI